MTTPLVGFGAAYSVASTVRDAISTELQNINQPLPRVYVTTGAIAWDACDSCGELVVAVMRDYLTDSLPATAAAAGLTGSGTQHGFEFAVQAIRCAPTVDSQGIPPSTAALEANARLVLDDATAVFCATWETLLNLQISGAILDFIVQPQIFVPPQGACTGSELVFAVTVSR